MKIIITVEKDDTGKVTTQLNADGDCSVNTFLNEMDALTTDLARKLSDAAIIKYGATSKDYSSALKVLFEDIEK